MKSSYFLFYVLCFLFSCSVSKQIAKQANTILLKDSAISTGHIGISIYEPATGKYWYNYQAEQFFIPASNTKLFSLYAGMKYLGDSLVGGRFETTNNSAITFEPSGDPTFLYSDFARQPVFELLKKYSSVNIVSPSYTDFVGSGWAWNDYKEGYMAQRNNFPIYGNTLKITLTNNELSFAPDYFRKYSILSGELKTGFLVDKPWDANKFSLINGRDKIKEIPFRPDIVTIQDLLSDTLKQRVAITWFSKRLGSIIHSQPSDSMFAMMMHRSDNFFAEQTLLMASNEKLGYMSDDKMIEHILKNDLADIPQKPKWIDGSGLSRYNLFTPKDFVYLLQKLKNDFGWERMKAILPTGGTGTLSSLYKKDSSYIFAKTGTLSNNAALSGYLITAKNKFLIFSILTNNFITGATPIRKAVEKFISNIRQRY